MKRLGIYMFFDAHGVVAPYIVHKLKALRPFFSRLVVVVNGALDETGRTALSAVSDTVHVRPNEGFDVHAYREALCSVVGMDEVAKYDETHLLNYTFYGPIFPFSEMFSAMDSQLKLDFWGVSAFNGPQPNEFTNKGMLPYHLQTHWIAVRQRMASSQAFRRYWEDMPAIENYIDSILTHESRFTEHFEQQGFAHGCYLDAKRYPTPNAVMELVDVTLADRCPILKRRAFFHDPAHMAKFVIELRRALKILKDTSDYDTSLIWQDITRCTKPRVLHTNAVLLDIYPTEGVVLPAPKQRIAVLAHLYYPDMADELLSHAEQIPQHFDLWLTTSSDEKKKQIEGLFAERRRKTFTLKGVRVVENRGRDVAAHFIGLRDVVTNYDLICRIHSKRSPQDSFGMARHFKEHLFDNLLGSQAYVSRILQHFADEPRMGMAIPPIIHVGYPTLGLAWFTNRPGAEHWAKKLKIRVPFDDDTPLAAYGSMYWYRPAALVDLFNGNLQYDDFPPEPDYKDGGTAHVLERLVVYACHNQGYYARSFLTTEHAAHYYVNLEFRLQNAIAHPAIELSQKISRKLSSRPWLHRLSKTGFSTAQKAWVYAKSNGLIP